MSSRRYPNDSPVCLWEEDEDGNWNLSCHNSFVFIEGTPEENGFVFCPFCGKKVEEYQYKYEEGD